MTTKKQDLPEGWDHEQLQAVAEYYDNQSDEEAIAEAEAALEEEGKTLVMVPTELMPVVRDLIVKHESDKRGEVR